MKITVEFSEKELREILKITRNKKKGPAIRQLAIEGLMLKKRREMLDDAWNVDLIPIEILRQDRVVWQP
jgi:hypothetical protein